MYQILEHIPGTEEVLRTVRIVMILAPEGNSGQTRWRQIGGKSSWSRLLSRSLPTGECPICSSSFLQAHKDV